jgi:hypothetical protein
MIRQVHAGQLPACEYCSHTPKCRAACIVNACGTLSDKERQLCTVFSQNGYQ